MPQGPSVIGLGRRLSLIGRARDTALDLPTTSTGQVFRLVNYSAVGLSHAYDGLYFALLFPLTV